MTNPFLALVLATTLAAPPSPGGLRGLVDGAFAQVWTRMQGEACERIRARLEAPGALAPGTTAYGTTCTFSGPGSLSLDTSHWASGLVGMRYSVPGNTLDFRTKSPLGRWFDPHFHVAYDLALEAHGGASWPSPVPRLNDATASALNVRVRGGNLSGDFARLFINPALNQSIDLKAAFDQALAGALGKTAP